jgi:Flp pilus assembly protein TadD
MDAHYDSALHYLKLAEILNPKDTLIKQAVFRVAYALGDWENALQAKRDLYRMGASGVSETLEDMVELDSRTGRGMSAFYFARELLSQEPNDPNRYIQFANSCIVVDSLHLALAAMDSAIERFGPEDIFLSNKALYYTYMGYDEEAEALFRALVARDSSQTAYKINLANCLSSQNDMKKKREALQIYRDIRLLVDSRYQIDSVIAALEKELGVEDTANIRRVDSP